MNVAFSHRSRPKVGESENGDAVVARTGGGVALFAVVDALGHGPAAASAAGRAISFLHEAVIGDDVAGLVDGLHRALRGSRGAAATVFVVRDGLLRGCGVGNVELRSRGTPVPFAPSPGILGSNRGSLRTFSQRLAPGDRLAVFSDGVARTLSLEKAVGLPVEQACTALFDEYATPGDDATLLLVETHA